VSARTQATAQSFLTTPEQRAIIARDAARGQPSGLLSFPNLTGLTSTPDGPPVVTSRTTGAEAVIPPPFAPGGPQQPYPAVLPPVSPELLAAAERRRQQATAAEQTALALFEDQRARAETERLLGMRQIEREGQQAVSGELNRLAGRGTARSPMFVNPAVRDIAERVGRATGQLEVSIGSRLEELGRELESARQARALENARIDFELAMERSNVNRLLGVS
jgi:hypothetical protein